MMDRHDEYYKAWLDIFSEGLLVILRVYADESILGHSALPVKTLGGFVAPPEDWGRFAKGWNSVLKKHDAPYFHFREFVDRRNQYKIKGNPFLKWDDSRREDFLDDLYVPRMPRLRRLQKFSMPFVWTCPRTYSRAWSMASWIKSLLKPL
jgi:hypothetical protein